jgi:hypothetical protein
MVECPQCGDEYKKLGNHWHYYPSHRPELTQKQIEITTGLLMGNGWIDKNKEKSRLRCKMISPNYLEYLDNIFGVLSCGVSLKHTAAESAKNVRNSGFRPDANEENYSDVYGWGTRSHPKFNEFREWYASGEKVWPEDIELTPTVLKHWYVGDGHYENAGTGDCIAITMSKEKEKTEKVSQYFTNVGLPEPLDYRKINNEYAGRCVARWSVEDSHTLWEYMGEPLPDFEYKWNDKYC